MRFLVVYLVLALTGCAGSSEDQQSVPKEYASFVKSLKKDMVKRGISKSTAEKVFAKNYYKEKPEVVAIDRKQAEFVLSSTDYVNRVVTKKRVLDGRAKYKKLYPLFKDMEKQYGVQFAYIVAFWGIETNFGEDFGKFEVVDALVMLSYDQRRSNFFKEELYQALKIIDKYGIEQEQMQGSWAGAMGHFQFMPSTFNAYAVDFDKDGKIDIWHSFHDASASASNYLTKIGWEKSSGWGMAVSLPWNFDYSEASRGNLKTVAEWSKLGVRTLKNNPLPIKGDMMAAVIVPEGRNEAAYLVLNNFRKIMVWNRSENYALAVGMLADYIQSDKPYKPLRPQSSQRLKSEDVVKVQSFINKFFGEKLEEDGKLGAKTKEALKKVQKEALMPQDGYPDFRILEKINNYDPDVGFSVPVQPHKYNRISIENR